MDKRFDALLFDMDGLLLDTERVFMEALVAVGVPLGLERATLEAFFLTLIGTSGAQTSRAFAQFLPTHLDVEAIEAQWRDENKARVAKELPLRPHAADVLPVLKAAGYPMAVVTSTKREPALHHLELAGLHRHFDLVVAGDEVAANKPDPAPYLQAAQGLGVDPTRCAAFEDSDTGTHAAVAAGCTTVQIPDLRPPVPLPDLGHHVAPNLRAAMGLLGVLPGVVAE